jgi:hypothetical protein
MNLSLWVFIALGFAAIDPRVENRFSQDEIITHITGQVTASDGKPIAQATVWWQGPTPQGVNAPTGSPTTTDNEGRFRLPIIISDPDTISKERYLVGNGFDVFAEGYVRFQERLPIEERVVLDQAQLIERDFVLLPGELIEGQVQVKAFEGFMSYVTARGPSFRQVYTTDLKGNFRFWVPKGTYTLSVQDAKSYGLNLMRRELSYAAKDVNKPVVVRVASGTQGIIVKD